LKKQKLCSSGFDNFLDPFAPKNSGVAAHRRSVHSPLVDEDWPLGIDARYPLAPGDSLFLVALRIEERLFSSGTPSLSSARLTLAVETETA
jgi:hypothetical protein